MIDFRYKSLVGGIHDQNGVDALINRANVVTVPGSTPLQGNKLCIIIGADRWNMKLIPPIDARREIQIARRRFGKNVVTPEFLLKQAEDLFWSLKFHNTPEFRRFLGGDIGVI